MDMLGVMGRWEDVLACHIEQAIDDFESNGVPANRNSKNTFLLARGSRYPAKFIRGRAYFYAHGIEPNHTTEFSGGLETVKFFVRRGYEVEYCGKIHGGDEIYAAPHSSKDNDQKYKANSTAKARGCPQKEALYSLLTKSFGRVVREAKFPWLTVPPVESLRGDLKLIHDALTAYRGFAEISNPGYQLSCDFFVPERHLIIEYDERQHFSEARKRALELYPAGLPIGFNVATWQEECGRIKAKDNKPPYRDEQRAFYDTLRDFLAPANGYRIIRLQDGSLDWSKADEDDLVAHIKTDTGPKTSPIIKRGSGNSPHRVGIVSHDYRNRSRSGFRDYSDWFTTINAECDRCGCDTILYALHTWDRRNHLRLTHDLLFNNLRNVKQIILEFGKIPADVDERPRFDDIDGVEIWSKEHAEPRIIKQCFAVSAAKDSDKELFMCDLSRRRLSDGLLVICGESNIVTTSRNYGGVFDPFGFSDYLDREKIRFILNPLHDYMKRYEMKDKRAYLSRNERTVVTVWNRGRFLGKGGEPDPPWTVYHDGHSAIETVKEIVHCICDRHDIRIGILKIP